MRKFALQRELQAWQHRDGWLATNRAQGGRHEGHKYKRAGVTLDHLAPAETLTMRLWNNESYERMRALLKTIDAINTQFGRDTVRDGLYERDGKWRTRFGKRSPRYPTPWDEILRVGTFGERHTSSRIATI